MTTPNEPLPPLDPELAELWADERGRVDRMPEAARGRVWSRVLAAPASLAPDAKQAAVPRGWLRSVAIFATGAAAGAGGYAALQPKAAPTAAQVVVEPRAQPTAATPPGPVAQPVPPPQKPRPLPHRAPVVAAAVPVPPPVPVRLRSSDDALAAERTLIDMARTALTRGETARALATLDRCSREFPGGTLGEEREALRVQALLAAGDTAGAKAVAGELARRFPKSFLLPALRESVQAAEVTDGEP